MLNKILGARLYAGAALASAALLAVSGDGGALHVSTVADRDCGLLVGDQVFQFDLRSFVFDERAALVAIKLLDFLELGDDYPTQLLFRAENGFKLGDVLPHLLQFVRDFVNRKPGQPVEWPFKDGIGLTS